MSWLSKLKSGLSKSAKKLSSGISSIFTGKRRLDSDVIQDFEDYLITCDIDPSVASHLAGVLSDEYFDKECSDEEIRRFLRVHITELLEPLEDELAFSSGSLNVLLFCGVNGNGKTTSIAKLSSLYASNGYKVLVAACDTFRAAAVEQLEDWCQRTGVDFFKGEGDPSGVAYQATDHALAAGYDILMIDTAGRLHNNHNLMSELAKIERIVKKKDVSCRSILVLDATTGNNALLQLEAFSKTVEISGIIVSKLDGTAKAGIVLNIQKYSLPIFFIGVGEGQNDMNRFKAEEFASNLLNL